MIYIKKIFISCFVIIGTIIGAGFASGKEIFSFFCVYGRKGFLGIIISSIFIGLIIYFSFKIITNNNIKTYDSFTNYLIGSKKIFSYTINNLINIFLFFSFIVMVSGFGSFFKQEYNVPSIIGSIIICVFSFITFSKSINGIIKINLLLIPILVFLILFLNFKNDKNGFDFNFNIIYESNNIEWLIKSFLYASYNSITLIPIIININSLIDNQKQIKYISFFSSILILIMALTIYVILLKYFIYIKNLDIPLIYIASKFGSFYKYLYGFTILIAIFTTAISAGFSFLNNISKSKRQYIILSILICILSILCSNIGFSYLINFLYPILGFLGFFEILLILHKCI